MSPRDAGKKEKMSDELISPYTDNDVNRTPAENIVPIDFDESAHAFLQIMANALWPPFYDLMLDFFRDNCLPLAHE